MKQTSQDIYGTNRKQPEIDELSDQDRLDLLQKPWLDARRRNRRATLALTLSRLTILADCFLLVLMSLTSPCLACMGAAFFLAVVFYSLYRAHAKLNGTKHPTRSRILAVWLLCMAAANIATVSFSVNIAAAKVKPMSSHALKYLNIVIKNSPMTDHLKNIAI